MNLISLNLKDFTTEVASSSPAPGGGSVAAYAGAQGFALISMVCRLTLGREKFKQVETEVKNLLEMSEHKQEQLLTLVDRDTKGFQSVMDALSMPKQTDDEKGLRRNALEKATLQAAEIPLETADLCLQGLQMVSGLLNKGNSNALSDMGVASLMLKAGLEGALYNVRINALGLKSLENKQALLDKCDLLNQQGETILQGFRHDILSLLR